MSEITSHNIGEPPKGLIVALRKILRPLVRLLLSQGITYPYLANLLKSIYVETAVEEFPVDGKRQTDSRISLLSGVHRKDVRRLRNGEEDEDSAAQVVSLGAQLVAHWVGVDEYIDEKGKPLPLPRLEKDSNTGPSFESLVESVSRRDIRSRVVLDEWIRLGVVYVDNNDCVVLNIDAFVPEKGFDEKVYYFGKIIHDHIAAAAENILSSKPPYFDRCVYYNNLAQDSVDELSALSSELGMELLKTINKKALELQKLDSNRPENNKRMNLGMFYFQAEIEQEKLE